MAFKLKNAFPLYAVTKSVAIELGGASAEFTALALSGCMITKAALKKGQQGEKRPVLLVPGLGAGEWHMEPLKAFLQGLGYQAYHWGQGVNTGLKPHTIDKLEERLKGISLTHGGEKVSLIGESLGGLMTQELERRRPELVRCSISLGTPRSGINKSGHISSIARAAYAAMNPWSWQGLTDDNAAQRFGTPPDNGVPKTAVIARYDQIANAQSTYMPESFSKAENVEVLSTHIGMACNPLVHVVIADRLAQDPDNWQRFSAGVGARCFFKVVPKSVLPDSPDWKGCPKSGVSFRNLAQSEESLIKKIFSAGIRGLASVT